MAIYPNIYQTLVPCPIVELRGYLAACGLKGRLYAYLDYNGPTGTSRDSVAEGMLALAAEKHKLLPGQPIIEAASGSFAMALALAGRTRAAYMVIYSTAKDMQGSTRLNPDDLQRAMQYDRTTDVARLINVEVPHSATGRLYLTLDAEPAANATQIAKTISPVMVSPDKSLGELDCYQHIRTAVQSKNYEQALAWVKAAEQAGFTKAKEVFFAVQQ